MIEGIDEMLLYNNTILTYRNWWTESSRDRVVFFFSQNICYFLCAHPRQNAVQHPATLQNNNNNNRTLNSIHGIAPRFPRTRTSSGVRVRERDKTTLLPSVCECARISRHRGVRPLSHRRCLHVVKTDWDLFLWCFFL